jgi:hypothetical protein
MEFSLYPIAFICGFSFVFVLRSAFSLTSLEKRKKYIFSVIKLQDKKQG